ncbi:hypothetical protein [Aequorivita xiaoshiensis]|uniref:Uncharacterized protein n=1 Tax=Aequorivita xiaoshiensis TaxID=2874476 RepID=A0A9X1U4I6_9FLAO|nr:hypothetical protein [Aequorivita xiaoshiensis]MCG2431819.1 hypothetical protein [Aequorivita xiaoshiensis]
MNRIDILRSTTESLIAQLNLQLKLSKNETRDENNNKSKFTVEGRNKKRHKTVNKKKSKNIRYTF